MEMAQAQTDTEFLTEGQLCALVHINPKTAQRWRLSGEGPNFCRIGKVRVVYRRSEVDAWLDERTFKHRAAEATGRQAVAA